MSEATPPKKTKVSQDRGLKAMVFQRPLEVIEALMPTLIARRGRPVSVVPLPQELHRHDLSTPSILLDIALRCAWADGWEEIVLLVEHHSAARKVVLLHVHQYHSELVARYHPLKVLPVVFVTDPSDRDLADTWNQEIDGTVYVSFKVELVRLGPEDAMRLRQLRTIPAAVFLALTDRDRIAAAVEMLAALEAVADPDDLRFYLPLGLEMARIRRQDIITVRARFKERSPMTNTVLDDWLMDERAEAAAKGKAEGEIDAVLLMVAEGWATKDGGKAAIEKLVARGTITRAQADSALAKLG